MNVKLDHRWRDSLGAMANSANMSVLDDAIDKSIHSIYGIGRQGRRPLDSFEEVFVVLATADFVMFGEAVGDLNAGIVSGLLDPRDVRYVNGQFIHSLGGITTTLSRPWRVECSSITYSMAWGSNFAEKSYNTVRPAIREVAKKVLGIDIGWDCPPAKLFED